MGIFGDIMSSVFGPPVPDFEVLLGSEMTKFDKGTHRCFTFKIRGQIGDTVSNPSSVILLLQDGDDYFLSLVPDCRINGDANPTFIMSQNLPDCNDGGGWHDFVDLGIRIPLEILKHPKKGTRLIECLAYVIDNVSPISSPESWIIYKSSRSVLNITFKDFGYMDYHDNRDRVKELCIDLCMMMSASDGQLDQSELDIVKNWLKLDYETLKDDELKNKEKEKFSSYLRKSYENAKSFKLKYDDLIVEINEKFDNAAKYSLVELLLEVISADGTFSSDEDKLLTNLVKSLKLDHDTVLTMKNKTFLRVESIESDSQDLDTLFGIVSSMSQTEKCSHLTKEYSKWLNQTTNKDEKKRERAKDMISKISKLRGKYNCK